MRLLYVIGVPGSGKSTLVNTLVQGRRRRVYHDPVLHTAYEDGLVQLGRERNGNSGTDAMSMSISPRVVAVLAVGIWPRILGEGDRLANQLFFSAATRNGYELDIVLLDTPLELAAERRAARGTTQNETWLRGRETKVEHLRPLATIVLDGRLGADELAAELEAHPVLMPHSSA